MGNIASKSILVALALCFVPAAYGEEDEQLYVNGKVTDQHNNPVAGAKLFLKDKASGKRLIAEANSRGDFQLKHPPTVRESLEVIPPSKTGLAQAFLDNISGERTKHVIVQLKKGFSVDGRVLVDGKGAKGVWVTVVPQTTKGMNDPIHGGGRTITDGSGSYHLVLTPGRKKMLLTNDRYEHVAGEAWHEVTITGDTAMPDLSLPSPH